MSDPLLFDSLTPRFGLPLLFAGQSQKELFVNEAHALTDALLHGAIDGEANAPPLVPVDGTSWLIGSAPTGEWADRAGQLACRQAGQWLFAAPRDGMWLLDRSTGQNIQYRGEWKIAAEPGEPTGGSIVDSQARAAISQLFAALRVAGIFPDIA